MAYDQNNIFARILRGEIPCQKFYENDYALVFHDAFPKAPVHLLVIPKGAYMNFSEFTQKAPPEEQIGFLKACEAVTKHLDEAQNGYRIISNCGPDGGQEVPHFHLHMLAGKEIGSMVSC